MILNYKHFVHIGIYNAPFSVVIYFSTLLVLTSSVYVMRYIMAFVIFYDLHVSGVDSEHFSKWGGAKYFVPLFCPKKWRTEEAKWYRNYNFSYKY